MTKSISEGGKESIVLRIAVCKRPLRSTEVKLTKITSASIVVNYGNAFRCVTSVTPLEC